MKSDENMKRKEFIKLPAPKLDGTISVEQALSTRRSVREFKPKGLSFGNMAQLLWSAQGITESSGGLRTAPSARALYPLEIILIASNVEGLDKGIYRYIASGHRLSVLKYAADDNLLSDNVLQQDWVRTAPAVISINCVYSRITERYGERGIRYSDMEVGLAAENCLLQAVALSLKGCIIGAFNDMILKEELLMEADETPVCLIAVGS